MTDLERRIRDALDDQARSAPPPHEAGGTLRRTRRRQLATAGGGALATLAVVAASIVGMTALMDAGGSRDEVPATGPTTTTTIHGISITHPQSWFVVDPDEVGFNSTPDGDVPTLPRLVLAVSPAAIDERFGCPGLVEGDPPTFLMTVQERPLALAGEASAPWPVEPTPLGELDETGCYPDWEFLGADWTAAGRSFRARIGLAPEILDADRAALLAAFESLAFEPSTEPTTSAVLATGTAGGEAWQLVAQRQGEELVLSLDAETFGMGAGAGFDPAAGTLTATSAVVGDGDNAVRFVFGAVPQPAVRLEVHVSGEGVGTSGPWEILDIPDQIGGDLNAFVFTIGEGQTATIDALDESGQVLASGEAGPNNDAVGTPVPVLPDEVLPEHGGTYFGLYLAASPSMDDREMRLWTRRMESIGYTPGGGSLACDDGAASALGLNPEWSGVAVYFASRGDALEAMRIIAGSLDLGDTIGVARVTTYCLD
jgi:hypothetical protein